jgi:hypothetical protein
MGIVHQYEKKCVAYCEEQTSVTSTTTATTMPI